MRVQGGQPRARAQRVLPLIEDNNWFFDTELLILAEKMGYRVNDVPVELGRGHGYAREDRGDGDGRPARAYASAHRPARGGGQTELLAATSGLNGSLAQ